MSFPVTSSRRRSFIFIGLILSTTFLSTYPSVFLWANTIDPRLFGLSFAMVWHIGLALVAAVFFALWYLAEHRSGALDIDVKPERQP